MSEKLIWSDMAREKLAKIQLPITLKNFEQNEDGSSLATYMMKIATEVADLSQKHLIEVIIEAAKAAGISDLTIVDEPSIMDYFRKLGAIKRNKCVCPYCGEPVPRSEYRYRYPQQTNADRIRNMTDEELAKFIVDIDRAAFRFHGRDYTDEVAEHNAQLHLLWLKEEGKQ